MAVVGAQRHVGGDVCRARRHHLRSPAPSSLVQGNASALTPSAACRRPNAQMHEVIDDLVGTRWTFKSDPSELLPLLVPPSPPPRGYWLTVVPWSPPAFIDLSGVDDGEDGGDVDD